nr:VP7 [Guaico Culex virus]
MEYTSKACNARFGLSVSPPMVKPSQGTPQQGRSVHLPFDMQSAKSHYLRAILRDGTSLPITSWKENWIYSNKKAIPHAEVKNLKFGPDKATWLFKSPIAKILRVFTKINVTQICLLRGKVIRALKKHLRKDVLPTVSKQPYANMFMRAQRPQPPPATTASIYLLSQKEKIENFLAKQNEELRTEVTKLCRLLPVEDPSPLVQDIEAELSRKSEASKARSNDIEFYQLHCDDSRHQLVQQGLWERFNDIKSKYSEAELNPPLEPVVLDAVTIALAHKSASENKLRVAELNENNAKRRDELRARIETNAQERHEQRMQAHQERVSHWQAIENRIEEKKRRLHDLINGPKVLL